MQHFNDNEKETIKNDSQSAILDFISAKFPKGYPCARPYIFLYVWSSYSALILSCVNRTKSLKFKMAARPPF